MIDYGLLHSMELTPLERDCLLALAQKYPGYVSNDFINSCQVVERNNTGSGFFTNFVPVESLARTEENREAGIQNICLNEIRLTSPNLDYGADVRLYLSGDRVEFLEVVANGDGNPFDSVQYAFQDEIVNYIEL